MAFLAAEITREENKLGQSLAPPSLPVRLLGAPIIGHRDEAVYDSSYDGLSWAKDLQQFKAKVIQFSFVNLRGRPNSFIKESAHFPNCSNTLVFQFSSNGDNAYYSSST